MFKTNKVWLLLPTVALLTATLVWMERIPGTPAIVSDAPKEGEPWNGPHNYLPVQVASNLGAEVDADVEQDLELTLTPSSDCASLTSAVRGIDGVVVIDDQEDHGPCVAG